MRIIEPPVFGFVMETSRVMSLSPFVSCEFSDCELVLTKKGIGEDGFRPMYQVMRIRSTAYDIAGR